MNEEYTKKEIDRLMKHLSGLEPSSKEYGETLKHILMLNDGAPVRRSYFGMSKETILIEAMNLVKIMMVLNYEKIGIVTSRAFNLIRK